MSQKNNLKHHINHQTQTDLTSEWFNFDKKFKAKRFASFISYKISFARKTSSNWLEFNLKQFQIKILQFTEFMSKNILTILTTLLFILGLGGVTAQAFAPDNLKPTALYQKLFAANKQVERDPYTSLKPDANNFVSKLDQCDLSLKYPKKMANEIDLVVYREGYTLKDDNPLLVESFRLLPELTKSTATVNYFDFTINCFKPEYQVPTNGLSVKSITKEELQKKTGWFITQADIKDIKSFSNEVYGAGFSTYGGKGENIEFVFNGKKYLISSIDRSFEASEFTPKILNELFGTSEPRDINLDIKGVFSNQVQVQFNSLTDNINDKEVVNNQAKAAPTQPTPSTSQNQPDESQSSVIKTVPVDTTLIKSVFRPNEGCGDGILENQAKLPDEQVHSYNSKNGIMTITNLNYTFNQSDDDIKQAVQLFDLVVNNKPIPSSLDSKLKDLSSFGSFLRTSCSGYYSYVLQDLKQPNFAQKSRATLNLAGQGEIGDPAIFIYAQNGNDLILILGPSLFSEVELDEIIKSCGYDRKSYVDFDKFDEECYKNKLTSAETIQKANKMVQELVNEFKLK